MKQLLILSGKGGTGKTTTAAAFIAFSKAQYFADCDVDAPNLHLVTEMDSYPIQKAYLGSQKANIDEEKCLGCGNCKTLCRFGAIHCNNAKYEINPLACEGCGVCLEACSAGAVTMADDIAGQLMLYQDTRTFSTAKLKMGRGNSGKLVTEVKSAMVSNVSKNISNISMDEKLPSNHVVEAIAVIDGSPGIGCPVIASISGVNMVLIVAEPSLSGMSDMRRILKTCSFFDTKAAICVNKYDTCMENTEEIEEFCEQNNIPFVGKIPYDSEVPKAVNAGKNIGTVDCKARTAMEEVYKRTMAIINNNKQ